jgi:UDP-N-acetylglucosamine 2-epimerase (non-hydrolysing)
VIIGTRPEALKLSPVVAALGQSQTLGAEVVFSGQHGTLLESVLADTGLRAAVDLRAESMETSLTTSVAHLLEGIDRVLEEHRPDGVVVQGDTNTTLAGALAAFHRQIPVFHVEAGLRTDAPWEPFPEEMNRRLVTRLASLHLAPTEAARDNLLREGVRASAIVVTGNTSIDAIAGFDHGHAPELPRSRPGAHLLLVTLHRRESIPVARRIAAALRSLVEHRADLEVLWVLHANAARPEVLAALEGASHLRPIEPVPHREFLGLMSAATAIVTDSGGIQEEAPAIGKPVIVLRRRTERPEAVEAGNCRVVGLDPHAIAQACESLLDDERLRESMSRRSRPFGDGHASGRIASAIEAYFAAHPRGTASAP